MASLRLTTIHESGLNRNGAPNANLRRTRAGEPGGEDQPGDDAHADERGVRDDAGARGRRPRASVVAARVEAVDPLLEAEGAQERDDVESERDHRADPVFLRREDPRVERQ